MTHIPRYDARAPEAVATLLQRHLLVPDVYWKPEWGRGSRRADVLAIDRAGRGDVHVVHIALDPKRLREEIQQALALPGHYRWVAYPSDTRLPKETRRLLAPTSDPGAIGLIEVFEMAGDSLGARVVSQAERFMTSLDDELASLRASRRPDRSYGERPR